MRNHQVDVPFAKVEGGAAAFYNRGAIDRRAASAGEGVAALREAREGSSGGPYYQEGDKEEEREWLTWRCL